MLIPLRFEISADLDALLHLILDLLPNLPAGSSARPSSRSRLTDTESTLADVFG